jgi:hypothetical protein
MVCISLSLSLSFSGNAEEDLDVSRCSSSATTAAPMLGGRGGGDSG